MTAAKPGPGRAPLPARAGCSAPARADPPARRGRRLGSRLRAPAAHTFGPCRNRPAPAGASSAQRPHGGVAERGMTGEFEKRAPSTATEACSNSSTMHRRPPLSVKLNSVARITEPSRKSSCMRRLNQCLVLTCISRHPKGGGMPWPSPWCRWRENCACACCIWSLRSRTPMQQLRPLHPDLPGPGLSTCRAPRRPIAAHADAPDVAAAHSLLEAQRNVCAQLRIRPCYDGVLCAPSTQQRVMRRMAKIPSSRVLPCQQPAAALHALHACLPSRSSTRAGRAATLAGAIDLRTSLPVIYVLKHNPMDQQRPVRVLLRDDHQAHRVRLLRGKPRLGKVTTKICASECLCCPQNKIVIPQLPQEQRPLRVIGLAHEQADKIMLSTCKRRMQQSRHENLVWLLSGCFLVAVSYCHAEGQLYFPLIPSITRLQLGLIMHMQPCTSERQRSYRNTGSLRSPRDIPRRRGPCPCRPTVHRC